MIADAVTYLANAPTPPPIKIMRYFNVSVSAALTASLRGQLLAYPIDSLQIRADLRRTFVAAILNQPLHCSNQLVKAFLRFLINAP